MKAIFCVWGDLKVPFVDIGGLKNAIHIMEGLENAIFWYRVVLKCHFFGIGGLKNAIIWVWWG